MNLHLLNIPHNVGPIQNYMVPLSQLSPLQTEPTKVENTVVLKSWEGAERMYLSVAVSGAGIGLRDFHDVQLFNHFTAL
jgi:hypothetical protein